GVGSVRGSLAVTTVGTSAIFGAISGISAACVATIGRIMYPAMRRAGYPENFSAGLVTAVGAIDIIIPPSIPMIVYGASAEESVPRLLGARHAVHHSRRHLRRRVLADRGGGGRLRLCRLRHPVYFSRARLARYRRGRLRHSYILGADSHHCRLRRSFLLAADRQSGSRGDRRLAAIAQHSRLDVSADD